MLGFTNPTWAYLIGPGVMFGLGYAARAFIDRYAPLEDDR